MKQMIKRKVIPKYLLILLILILVVKVYDTKTNKKERAKSANESVEASSELPKISSRMTETVSAQKEEISLLKDNVQKTKIYFAKEPNDEVYISRIEGLGFNIRPYCGFIINLMPPFETDADFKIESTVNIYWHKGFFMQNEIKSTVSTKDLNKKRIESIMVKINDKYEWSIEEKLK